MKPFVSTAPFEPAHPQALALYCSDGRFTKPVEDLAAFLGHERLDALCLPGGPGLLNWLATGFVDLDATERASTFLIRGHSIREVILVAHQGCGYYRARCVGLSSEDILAMQVRDLRAAAKFLGDRHKEVTVRMFYAQPASGKVRFTEVPPADP